jgi:uncharacterized protein (TIGR03067 family)
MKFGLHAALALFAGVGWLAAEDPPSALPRQKESVEKAAASPLEGRYTVVSGEKDGKAVPAEKLKGSVVVFTGDKIVGTDKDRKEFFAATFTLDTAKKPWPIKMKSTNPKEMDATGLVKKEGDTITIVYALPGGDAPAEFKTKDKQHLFVLKPNSEAPPKDPTKVIKP